MEQEGGRPKACKTSKSSKPKTSDPQILQTQNLKPPNMRASSLKPNPENLPPQNLKTINLNLKTHKKNVCLKHDLKPELPKIKFHKQWNRGPANL